MCRSLCYDICESFLVDSTMVMYNAEDFKVDDTCIQLTINIYFILDFLDMIVLFLRYMTLS